MKAIIPVAGVGTRLRPHTYSQPKPLIPVAGKPILGFIIDRLVKAGCTEFVFVIGYLGEKIEAFVRETYPDLSTRFVIQNKREGLGHAIYLTKDYVSKGEDIFIVLGDTIFEGDIESVIQSTDSALGLKRVDDPRDFGVAVSYAALVIPGPDAVCAGVLYRRRGLFKHLSLGPGL